jgi:hypothetical protein
MRRASWFTALCLLAGVLLLAAGVGSVMSPWYAEGGVIGWMRGSVVAADEHDWATLVNSSTSFVVGGALAIASLFFFGMGLGGFVGAFLGRRAKCRPKPQGNETTALSRNKGAQAG